MTTAPEALAATIDEAAPRLGVPGVAAAVVEPDETRFHCCGAPVVDDPRPVGPDTVFQIGSVSKPLAAMVVHALVAEGSLGLDTTANEVLERDDLPPATIADLLGHQAGLDGDRLLCHPPSDPSFDAAVDALAAAPGLGRVGGEPSYSNAAYTVLGAVVERIEGVSFAAAMRTRLLRPLRMRRTMTTADEAITHVVALPHQSHGDSADLIPGGAGWQPRWELAAFDVPAGGVLSTAADLAGLARYLLGIDAPARPPLPPGGPAALWSPRAQIGTDEWTAGGFLVDRSRSEIVVHHPGVTAGYGARLTLVPDRGIGIVVLTNATAGAALADEATDSVLSAVGIERSVVTEPASVAAGPESGRYEGGLGITIVTTNDDGIVTLVHESHADGRWQPFPDPPWTGRPTATGLVGVEDERTVPFGVTSDGAWIRWNRRLRIRTG